MPSLPVAGMPDGNQLPVAQPAMPTQQPVTNSASPSMLEHMINRLSGTGGEDRYQLWPEKVVRDALSAAHDAYNSKEPLTSQDLIKPAMDMSALAGTGGLAGADATLGSAPFLRPALKYEGKIYKAPMGGQHLDAIPADVYPKFQQMAMNGEDINHFNFGFMNHKGQFLDREKALDYAIKEGLLDPNSEAARANTLTSTLMADSSKEGAAIDAVKNNQIKLGNSTAIYTEHPDHFEIESVRTPNKFRRQGEATNMMNYITNQADVAGKPVRLIASGLDKKTSTQLLVDFYKKHGFEVEKLNNGNINTANMAGDPWMKREPK